MNTSIDWTTIAIYGAALSLLFFFIRDRDTGPSESQVAYRRSRAKRIVLSLIHI